MLLLSKAIIAASAFMCQIGSITEEKGLGRKSVYVYIRVHLGYH